MTRQNFLHDQPWNEEDDENQIRSRVFWRPPNATLGATLYELQPGSHGIWLHMHYGAEEMFFVVNGRPTLRNGRTEEQLEPGGFVFCPDGRAGLHAFANQTDEPARILAISAGRFPDVVAYPEHGLCLGRNARPGRGTGRRGQGDHRPVRSPNGVAAEGREEDSSLASPPRSA